MYGCISMHHQGERFKNLARLQSEELPWSKNIVERILEYKSLRTDFCPKMSAMQSASSCSCSLCIVLFSLSNIIPLPG